MGAEPGFKSHYDHGPEAMASAMRTGPTPREDDVPPQLWPATKSLQQALESLDAMAVQLEDRLDSVSRSLPEAILAVRDEPNRVPPGSSLARELWMAHERVQLIHQRLERLLTRIDV